MSVRRIEQGVVATSSFSLRDITDPKPPVQAAMPFSQRRPSNFSLAAPTIPSTAGLSFKFSSPVASTVAPTAPATPRLAATTFSSYAPASMPKIPPAMPVAMSNPFASPQYGGNSSQEVMRLTAATDDLRQRLKVSTDKCCQLEQNLQRSNTVLARERQSAQQQVSAAKQELGSVRDSELKLRTELAQRPSVTEFKASKFQSAVRTAMEVEETNARVADAEARIIQLTKRSESLRAEVKVLESARSEALDVAAANSKAMFTEEQIADKIASLAEADTKVSAAEDRLAVLTDDIVKNEALRDSHRSDTTQSEMEMVAANEALVKAVSDLTATKQEQGETALKVAELKEQLVEIEADIDTAKSREFEAITAPAPAAIHKLTVTGDMPPTTTLGFHVDTSMRRIEAAGCSGCGMPYHFNTDAPITIGALSSPEGSTPIDEMVKAIVSDLKGYFAFAAEENAKRGMSRGMATGDAGQAIEVA